MKNIQSYLFVFFVLLALVVSPQIISAKANPDIENKYETAKMNLILGEFNVAKDQFVELEEILVPIKDKTDKNKDLYSDVMYNLGIIYDQKYEIDKEKSPLEGASTEDLMKADNYFEKADPIIFQEIALIDGKDQDAYITRAVGGVVGNVLKKKVTGWLNSTENCKCSFSENELKVAGNLFITLTEKEDIPELKDLKTRDKKIQEIFDRITKYISKLSSNHPAKDLYSKKIKISCKI